MALRIALVLFLIFTGCTLGPDYQRPSVSTPENYRGLQGTPAADSLADMPWWEIFRDPVLQELIREALKNNYDLRTAAARVEEARAQVGVSRSFLYPSFNLNAGGSAQQVSRATDPSQSDGANRSWQNWFGRVRHGVGGRCLRPDPPRSGSCQSRLRRPAKWTGAASTSR